MNTPPEETIWKGTPSAALDFWLNVACLLILPIPWALARWVQRRNHVIEITNDKAFLATQVGKELLKTVESYRAAPGVKASAKLPATKVPATKVPAMKK